MMINNAKSIIPIRVCSVLEPYQTVKDDLVCKLITRIYVGVFPM